MKINYILLIKFCFDDARVFQRVPMNLNVTIGHAACRLLYRYNQGT